MDIDRLSVKFHFLLRGLILKDEKLWNLFWFSYYFNVIYLDELSYTYSYDTKCYFPRDYWFSIRQKVLSTV